VTTSIFSAETPTTLFSNLGIAQKLLDALHTAGYVTPTPIQRDAIPVALSGNDLVGIAQTGTGKTLAFGVPMIQRLASNGGQGLVVLPTRELALQVDENIKKFASGIGVRTAVLIGGASMFTQLKMLERKPHIIIGTPGRIIDHLEQKSLTLSHIRVLILDEADRMLDMGFLPQIKTILENTPTERQTMLFSATMPSAVASLGAQFMKKPLRIEIERPGTAAATVSQEMYIVSPGNKIRLLDHLLSTIPGRCIVFVRTKYGTRRIARQVNIMGYSASEIHSDRTLSQRKKALHEFKNGIVRVLIATDIAARGIDINDVELVVNYDIPEHADDYIHRIGRTGRAGKNGRAITFAEPSQTKEIAAIEKLLRSSIPQSRVPKLPELKAGVRPKIDQAKAMGIDYYLMKDNFIKTDISQPGEGFSSQRATHRYSRNFAKNYRGRNSKSSHSSLPDTTKDTQVKNGKDWTLN